MEGALSVREYLIDMGSDVDDKASGRTPSDDQFFLLYFIMGTYFGPDLKDQPPKSVFQRRAEGLPPYTTEDLSSTHMKMIELERVYYYILRKADQSVIVKLPWLQQFLHGSLSTSKKTVTLPFPQFDDLFPPDKHPHSLFKGQYEAINNIVFISDPNVLNIGQEYLERFMRLTKLEDLILDRNAAMRHTTVDGKVLYNINVQEIEYHNELRPSSSSGREEDINDAINDVPYCDTLPIRSECVINNGVLALCGPDDCVSNGMTTSDLAELGSDMIFLPFHPTKEEWINVLNATKSGCALTGTATMGQIGPSIGNIDIGESDDSYIFRVALPGVKRDEREFSCEVEDDGKVSIRGVTVTGEKTVCRFDQVFEMQSQKLCPQGHFSVSFKLPGPVDPQQFSGNFGTDGILEGIVMKARRRTKR